VARVRYLPPKSVSIRKSGRAAIHWSITVPESFKKELGWKKERYEVVNLFWVDIGLLKGALIISEVNEEVLSYIERLGNMIGAVMPSSLKRTF